MSVITAEQWSQKLKDPTSRQAVGKLRDVDNMSALGHLADMIDPSAWSLTDHGRWLWRGDNRALWQHRPDWLSDEQEETAFRLSMPHRHSLPEIAEWIDAGMPPHDEWVAALEET